MHVKRCWGSCCRVAPGKYVFGICFSARKVKKGKLEDSYEILEELPGFGKDAGSFIFLGVTHFWVCVL